MAEIIENDEELNLTSPNVLRLRGIQNSGTSLPARPTRSVMSYFGRNGGLRQRSSRLSKYGVSFQPPEDDAIHYASDAKELAFFEKARYIYFMNF